MSSLVRAARPADADAIGRIHSESWRLTYAGLVSPHYLATLDEEPLAERWRQRLVAPSGAAGSALVAEQDGAVIGFALFGPTSASDLEEGFAGEIQMLYVLPAGQRRGHGCALFEHAAADLAARRLFWLVVWVVEDNHAARAFYRRMGLEPDGRRRVAVLGGQPVQVVRYAGPLNPVVVELTRGRPGRPPRWSPSRRR
ncbi:MAG TPA: GNAT family N-acetyltransferase [Kofleriaceae bacterium]|nr:GNAT family N-acetyltransferase [Kofleriaceae bacterium]